MNLFGAATSGVDPQTGSYLSKEQRIAMFQATMGQGVGGGGKNTNSKRAIVSPKSAIIRANFLTRNFQSDSEGYRDNSFDISLQVDQNRKSIENLYSIINKRRVEESKSEAEGRIKSNVSITRDTVSANLVELTQTLSAISKGVDRNRQSIENIYQIIGKKQENDLKSEKAETRNLLVGAERSRRNLKENFIEGISGAASAAFVPLQKAASAVQKPILSLWDKIKNALLLLGAAWVIDNLPSILAKFDDFFDDLGKLKTTFSKSLVNIRGVFSLLDVVIRGVVRGIKSVVSTAFRVGRFIFNSAASIASKVFGAIKKVIGAVVDSIWKGVKFISRGLRGIGDAARGLRPSSSAPKLSSAEPPKNIFQRIMGKVGGAYNRLKDFAGDQFGKMKAGADKFMTGFKDLGTKAMEKLNPIKAYATKEGIETGTEASRVKGIQDLLGKVFERANIAGKGILQNVGKLARGILKRVPAIGFAIDVMLNKAGGQGTGEAIIRGLASSIAGMVGLKAGATIGAGVGTVAIPIPGVGTAVGGILGGLIGSILAGSGADALAKAGMEVSGMETTSDTKMMGNYDTKIQNIYNNTIGKNDTTSGQPRPTSSTSPSPAAAITPSTPSTPEGMNLPEGSNTTNIVNVQEMPPLMDNLKEEKAEVIPEQTQPAISTRDPQTDFYRAIARKNYQLDLIMGAN